MAAVLVKFNKSLVFLCGYKIRELETLHNRESSKYKLVQTEVIQVTKTK